MSPTWNCSYKELNYAHNIIFFNSNSVTCVKAKAIEGIFPEADSESEEE